MCTCHQPRVHLRLPVRCLTLPCLSQGSPEQQNKQGARGVPGADQPRRLLSSGWRPGEPTCSSGQRGRCAGPARDCSPLPPPLGSAGPWDRTVPLGVTSPQPTLQRLALGKPRHLRTVLPDVWAPPARLLPIGPAAPAHLTSPLRVPAGCCTVLGEPTEEVCAYPAGP